jgi:thymidylate synthase (methanogen type)
VIDDGIRGVSEDGADVLNAPGTICCHINKPMDQLPELIRLSPLGPMAMEQYMHDFVDGVSPDDPRPMDFEYTYHDRLFNYSYPGHYNKTSQIQNIIDKLKRNPFSRRAVSVLWKPWEDIDSHDPPCLDMIKVNTSSDCKRANMSCVFRSHDLIGGWKNNVYALTYLLKHIADQTGRGVGYLEIISFDGHIYMSDWDKVETIKKVLKIV